MFSSIRKWSLILLVGCSALAMQDAYANKSGVAPGVLVLPKGPGSLGGVGENVKANLNMGLMSYSINVLLPKGRGQATPKLRITYSSSAGAGMMGIGWSLQGVSHVERGTVRGLPTYTDNDIFFAGGELVKIPGAVFYRARMEGGFVRYQWKQPDKDQKGYWIAEYPDGSKGYFGANDKGETDDNAQVIGLKGTYRWSMMTKVDRNGNRVEYKYAKIGSQTYIDTISWVFDDSGNPLYQVQFDYEERPDLISDGKPGFDLQTTRRLKGVRITSAGKQFRRYEFLYENATGLSRLIHVKRIGRDDKSVYPVQFKMKYSDATFSKTNSKLTTLNTRLGVDFRNGNADFIDINGDGLPDVVDSSNPKHIFHFNTVKVELQDDGNFAIKAHDVNVKRENPTETSAKLSNSSVQMLDVDGNGFTDLVDAVNKQIYLNFGNGRWEARATKLQNFPVTGTDPNMRFMDYNGDKKIDVVSSDGTVTTYWVSDGKGNWQIINGKMPIGRGFDRDKLRLIDMNGDGLMDVVYITSDSLEYRKYLGYGNWSEWIKVNVPGMDKYALDKQAQFDDINGDGMADMVAIINNSIVYFVNKDGRNFAEGKRITEFGGGSLPESSGSVVRIVDINGNGSRDIVWVDSNGQLIFLELFNKRPNLMTEIANNIGQRINVEYGSSVYYYLRDGSCDKAKDKACSGPWQNKMPMPFTVVTRITTWASRSDDPDSQAKPTADEKPQVQHIYYHDGFYDGKEKKFRGFRHVETLYDGDDSVGTRKDEIKYDVGDKDPYFHGKLLESIISDGAAKTYRKVAYTWGECPVTLGVDGKTLSPPIRFICQKATETTHIEGQAQEKWRITRSEVSFDGFGNVILNARLGEKNEVGDEKYTKMEYITPSNPNGEGWLLRAAKRVFQCATLPNDTGDGCAETQLFYDGEAFEGLPLGQIKQGNMTRQRIRVLSGKDEWVVPMRRKYDKYGNLIAYRGLTPQIHEVEWDSVYHRFPVSESIKLDGYSLIAKTLWDYAQSKVVQSTDYNGHNIFYTYDVFGRLLTMGNPSDPSDKPSIRYTYELKAPLSRIITETRSQSGGAFDRKQIVCFDGLGRKLSTRQKIGDNKYQVASHTAYNRLNQRAQIWDMYHAGEACSFAAPSGVLSTKFFYDGMSRLLRTVHRDGTVVRTEFEPFLVRNFDAEDNRKDSPFFNTPRISHLDGLGRVVRSISMPTKGKEIETRFTYSVANVGQQDLIASISLSDGSKKSQEYDLLGNLRKVIEPDRKEVRFVYNTQNKLAERIDSRGKTMVFTYDDLGRTKTMGEKDNPATLITYTYDRLQKELPTATNLKGHLTKVTSPAGAYYFSYDVRGLPVLQRRVTLGVAFDVKREYDNASNLIAKVFPDGRRIELKRDGAGRLIAIPGALNAIEYNDNGTLKSWLGANGIRQSYTFNARRWMIGSTVAKDSAQVFKLSYKLDGVGNILSFAQQHGDDSFTNAYEYDAMYRLTKASLLSGKEIIKYQQNDMDNLLAKISSLGKDSPTHMEKLSYQENQAHQLIQADQIKLKYDDAGHVLQRGDTSRLWDYMGRITEVKRGSTPLIRNWYDNQMTPLVKEEAGVHTFYISEQFEIRDGVGIAYIKLGLNRTVAMHSPAISAVFFDDLAPASGEMKLTAKPDGVISAADAWVYHAAREGIVTATRKKRTIDIDMTKDMLRASLSRMLAEKGEQLYLHADHVGSVRAVTNDSGQVVSRTHYYPYGAIRQQSGISVPYQYMNAEYQRSTKTHRFKFRTLDPVLGRWLSPDPAFTRSTATDDEFNSYGMVQNNPIRMREYMGTISLFGPDDNHFQQGLDLGFMTGAMLMTPISLVMMKKMRSSKDFIRDTKSGRRSKMLGSSFMTASWALWGASAGASLLGADDAIVKGLSAGSMVFWMAAEAVSTHQLQKQHKKETNVAFKGRKTRRLGRIAATAGAGLVAITSAVGIMDDPIADKVSMVGSFGSIAVAVLSALSSPAGAQRLDSISQKIQRKRNTSSSRKKRSFKLKFKFGKGK